MRKIILIVFAFAALSGCTCGTHFGYLTGTTIGIEISTGGTNTVSPVTFVLGYRRVEAVITPTNTTKVPSALGKVAGDLGTGGVDVAMQGDQYFAIGEAATILAKEIKIVEER